MATDSTENLLKRSTLMHYAAYAGFPKLVKFLLDRGRSPDVPGWCNRTPLYCASQYGCSACVKILLEYDANPNVKESRSGHTPLSVASRNGHAEIVQLLLYAGADKHAVNAYNSPAIYFAAREGRLGVIEILVANGVEINYKGEWNITPVQNAVQGGHYACIVRLIELGANIHAVDVFGRNALHMAAECGYVKIINLLMRHGINKNAQDDDGNTALHLAVMEGRVNVVKALLSSQCIVSIKNYENKTALTLAQQCQKQDVEDVLSEYTHDRSGSKKKVSDESKSDSGDADPEHRIKVPHKTKEGSECTHVSVGRMRFWHPFLKQKKTTYNISSFLKSYFEKGQELHQLDSMFEAIDRKVFIQPDDEDHVCVINGISSIIRSITSKIAERIDIFKSVKAVETGSLYSGLKVGLPYEGDLLLEIDYVERKDMKFTYLCQLIVGTAKEDTTLPDTARWTLFGVKTRKVCVTLILGYQTHNGETVGVSIDMTPVQKYTKGNTRRRQMFSNKCSRYLEQHGILDECCTNLYTLLSPARDNSYDNGIPANFFIQTLNENQKSGFRVAKYLLQNDIYSTSPEYEEFLDSSTSLKLFGYSSIVKSFHLRMCLIHVIFATYETDIGYQLEGSALAMCLLDIMAKTFLEFSKFRTDITKFVSFRDPMLKDKIKYEYRLNWSTHEHKNLSRQVQQVMTKFKRNATTRNIADYPLLNYRV